MLVKRSLFISGCFKEFLFDICVLQFQYAVLGIVFYLFILLRIHIC